MKEAPTPFQYTTIDFTARLDAIELALVIAVKNLGKEQRDLFISGYSGAAEQWRDGALNTTVPDLYLQRASEHAEKILAGVRGPE